MRPAPDPRLPFTQSPDLSDLISRGFGPKIVKEALLRSSLAPYCGHAICPRVPPTVFQGLASSHGLLRVQLIQHGVLDNDLCELRGTFGDDCLNTCAFGHLYHTSVGSCLVPSAILPVVNSKSSR